MEFLSTVNTIQDASRSKSISLRRLPVLGKIPATGYPVPLITRSDDMSDSERF